MNYSRQSNIPKKESDGICSGIALVKGWIEVTVKEGALVDGEGMRK